MTAREPAWRVLGQEFTSALQEEKGTGERAASYLLSPLGARMNRVLMVGQLSTAESIGRDESQPFLRSQLTDPTGTVAVTAGGFQPRALAALKGWTSAGLALVVGKAHLYRGRDGVGYSSVRLEALRALDEPGYRRFLLDAVEQTMDRLDLVERARSPPASNPVGPAAPPAWVAAARAAAERYPSLDRTTFESGLRRALNVAEGRGAEGPAPSAAPSPPVGSPRVARPAARISRTPAPARPPEPTAQDRARESSFLDIVDELCEASVDGYADLPDLLARAASRGLPEVAAEELLNRLEEEGVLEEPVVGKLRRA